MNTELSITEMDTSQAIKPFCHKIDAATQSIKYCYCTLELY